MSCHELRVFSYFHSSGRQPAPEPHWSARSGVPLLPAFAEAGTYGSDRVLVYHTMTFSLHAIVLPDLGTP